MAAMRVNSARLRSSASKPRPNSTHAACISCTGVAVPILVNIGNPVNGGADLNDGQAADLLAGKWYVNIHTQAHPPGEIRGQMMKVN